MLLRNQDTYLDLLQIDVARDVWERRQMTSDSKSACKGCFFEHGGSFFGLGVDFGRMYVILNGQLLRYDDTLETKRLESVDFTTFSVTQDSVDLCRVEYTPWNASGWIPNEDDECVDGFLWLHNVLRNPERRSIMFASEASEG